AVDTDDYAETSSILRYWHEARLSIFDGDMDRFIELSRIPFDLNEGHQHSIFFALFKSASMTIFTERGDLDEARRVAETLLEQEAFFRTRDEYECTCYLGSLAHANTVLGDTGKAERLIEELVEGTGWAPIQRRRMLGDIDAEQAAEMAFVELSKDPGWDGFDAMAVDYLFYRDFLAHPRVQEYYVKQGKWVDYLAERVPEYAKYRRVAASEP
ncbi:MAG: hypothetical protein ABF290_04075, partial [Thiogranum sp.]